ncbi:hypothetical protein POSPLADRAFT_1137301 [Postia placenta MAD-698-R-SB12]|uniref:RING-type domain-containing protein n=1 Tax=Postia placenta MAD-698-R-SB12 TaxID=670580 RepID=A0A1X6N6H7_9APHY|nr:hypothetical protein POSPLADRAFT_1137301 [Postia placenta MAD-698-R-SB12]OSX64221.1 hypothetical protein POSPLADRAFT_1137301 [Postia placenta MAD-698-R-SB12]
MRNYHIRISLQTPPPPASTASTSYSERTLGPDSPTFTPKSIFESLPSHSRRAPTRRYTLTAPGHNRHDSPSDVNDYRFGPITIDWSDCHFNPMSLSAPKKTGAGKEKELNRSKRGAATFIPRPAPNQISGTTHLPGGVVHIYRDNLTSADAPESIPVSQSHNGSQPQGSSTETDPCSTGLVLAVLAVPSWMTPSDFLAFVAPAAEGIALLRMIRDSAPNRSLVLLKFREVIQATEFAEVYNGKSFNSMEAEICHVVRVASVVIDSDDSLSHQFTKLSLSHEPGSVYELPTCPVCLERMDAAVTGLVTVPCSHTFHCACLSKWGDSRCPVCRYSQTLLSSHPPPTGTRSQHIPFSLASTATQCTDCGSTGNLWICLICGNVGCGRYGRAHAHAHYTRTTHLYALELETQRVWDYAGDGYVHRLIQNKADGKLVELPSAAIGINGSRAGGESAGPSAADALSAEKIEAIGIEYSYLLTSQLDSQRVFYEEKTTELQVQIETLRGLVEGLSSDLEAEKVTRCENEAKIMANEKARHVELEGEVVRLQTKMQKTTTLAQKLAKELQDERAVSKGLMENLQKSKQQAQQAMKEKTEAQNKVKDLEEQLRDIMFYLEARNGIETSGGLMSEAAGGSIVLGRHA